MSFFDVLETYEREWTPEQTAIFEHVAQMSPGEALAIRALAGTGKTTTAIQSFNHTRRPGERGNGLFLAFNATNGKELDQKTPANVSGSTFHSLLVKLLKPDLEIGKIWRISKGTIEDRKFKLRAPAVALASLGKNLGIGLPAGVPDTLEVWTSLVGEYGIRHQKRYAAEDVASAARRIFHASLRDTAKLDFDDLLYVAARDGLGDGFTPVDWLYVDEFQDTNPVQLFIIDQILQAGGGRTRLVFIGDPSQAIYGWRGAGVRSFDLGVRRYRASVLGLTTSWRCPQAVIRCAQEIVPAIKARSDAAEGLVETMALKDFDVTNVPAGDVVLCRNNAPLFELVLEAVSRDKAVHVMGVDIAGKTMKVFEKIFLKAKKPPRDRAVFSDEIVRIMEEYADRPLAQSLLMDEIISARAIWDIVARKRSGWNDYTTFADAADEVMKELLFDPDKVRRTPPGVVFSTIHRSKGLEWDNVWIYRPELMPSKSAQKLGGWHLEQEYNLSYVARTRARRTLRFVTAAPSQGGAFLVDPNTGDVHIEDPEFLDPVNDRERAP